MPCSPNDLARESDNFTPPGQRPWVNAPGSTPLGQRLRPNANPHAFVVLGLTTSRDGTGSKCRSPSIRENLKSPLNTEITPLEGQRFRRESG